jgi:hypothetical protein
VSWNAAQVTAPIRHQVVEVQVYRAVADRSRGRRVGGALIPLIDLLDCSAPLGEDMQDPFLPQRHLSSSQLACVLPAPTCRSSPDNSSGAGCMQGTLASKLPG